MVNYKKIYQEFNGVDDSDFIECAVCKKVAGDIHHIECKGMGGNPLKDKDHPLNLIPLCRDCHTKYGDIAGKKVWLFKLNIDRILKENSKKGLAELHKLTPEHTLFNQIKQALEEL